MIQQENDVSSSVQTSTFKHLKNSLEERIGFENVALQFDTPVSSSSSSWNAYPPLPPPIAILYPLERMKNELSPDAEYFWIWNRLMMNEMCQQ